ncbi:hypothetical protein SAY87_009932 [Trapa incisa]|uniref:BHLH domain-containing protein n=1 Tax=Trapa incisa TaxID=236973 RepID=A0AAN7JHR2_9MYRT|nr:hypothetical protein SAY87_009932 [Trapa incisa]
MWMKDMVVPGSRPDFSELVWENGTLLVRGRTSPNSGAYTTACPRFFSNNQLVGCEEEDDDREFGGGGESNRPDSDRNCELYQAPTSYLPSGFTPNNHALPKNIDFSKASSAGSHGGEMKRMNFSHFRGFDSLMFDADSVQGMGSGQHGMAPAKGVVVNNKLSKQPSDEMDVQTGNSQEQQQPIHAGVAGVLMAGSRDSLVPDEHSQAVVDSFVEEHFIREGAFEDDHLVPRPDSSMEVSDAAPCNSKRRRLDQQESRYHDKDQEEEEVEEEEEGEEEEMADHKKRALHHARVSTGTKRGRSANHNLSEKKRRDRINKRMRALQELLPNCDKVDKASVLDEAIEYMKKLQLQLQMMSTGSRVFSSPMAMFPAGMHQLPLSYMNQFPLGSAGVGPAGFIQGQIHQFPLPGHGSAAALAGGFKPMYMLDIGGNPALRFLVNGVEDFSRANAAMTMIQQLALSAATKGSSDAHKAAGR